MRLLDSTGMAFTAIVRYPLRSSMLLVAIAIGVSAVLVLPSLGEGARRYVTEQFSSLGTHLLMVTPGKNEVGGLGGMAGGLGHSPRPLTLQDAMALQRSIHISTVTALTVGTGSINFRGVEREVDVVGTTSTQQQLFKYEVIKGRFIPEMDMDNTSAIAVIGHTIAGELFGTAEPVGKWVRLGDLRVRVIGVLAQTGQSGGRDMDDTVLVPVGFAMQMYNRESIHRLMIEAVNAGGCLF